MSGWLEYDREFRQQATADPSIRWNSLNSSVMAATVLMAPSATLGLFCLEAIIPQQNVGQPIQEGPRSRPSHSPGTTIFVW